MKRLLTKLLSLALLAGISSAPSHAADAMKVKGEYPEIYGSFITDTNNELQGGLYRVPTSSDMTFTKVIDMTGWANNGGTYKDGIYYYNDKYLWYDWAYIYGYNVKTGTRVYNFDAYASDYQKFMAPGGMALDPTTNEIYGIFRNDDLTGIELAKISYPQSGRPTKTTIAGLNGNYDCFAIDGKGQFYCIKKDTSTGEGILCTISRTSGIVKEVGKTGHYNAYTTGAAIEPRSNRMFWAVSTDQNESYLAEVDLATGKATIVTYFPDNRQVGGLYVLPYEAEDGAPDNCSDVKALFDKDSLSGKISFKAPASTFVGGSLTGTVDVTVTVNGEKSGTVKGLAPGANGELAVTVPSKGVYTFSVYATNSVGDGPKTSVEDLMVGEDSPAPTVASAKYSDGKMHIGWEAALRGINGGYLDPSKISYSVSEVKENGAVSVLASNLKVTEYSYSLTAPEDLTLYNYTVTVNYGGEQSEPASTNTVVLGHVVPPYDSQFKTQSLRGWTVIDANEDGKFWRDWGYETGDIYVTYNYDIPMDDWLITPPLKMMGESAYELTFDIHGMAQIYTEKFEVKYGKEPTAAAMTELLVEPTELTSGNKQTFTVLVTPDVDGDYYIGFHGISEPHQGYIYITSVKVGEGVSTKIPGTAPDLKAAPDPNGAFTCDISFKAPALDLLGEPLKSLSRVELKRDGNVIKTWTAPAMGSELSYHDTMTKRGKVTYTVIGYNDYGTGVETVAETFIGYDVPKAPANVAITTTGNEGEVKLVWDAVTEDINGKPLGADDVSYIVWEYNNGWVPLIDELTTTSYTTRRVEAGTQEFVQLAVTAVTVAGSGADATSEVIPAGTPYNGIDETFAGGAYNYIWDWDARGTTWYSDVDADAYTDDDFYGRVTSRDGDNGFLGIYHRYQDFGAVFYSGLVTLKGASNPGLSFYTYSYMENDRNTLEIQVREAGTTEWITVYGPKSIDDICGGTAGIWGKVVVPLSAYAGKTIQMQMISYNKNVTYTFVDDIHIGDLTANDLAATGITAPSLVRAGADMTVDVKVANYGAKDASEYYVEIYANDNLVTSQKCGALKAGQNTTVSVKTTMAGVAKAPVSYYAKVNYALDEDNSNNQSASVDVTPIPSTLPAPENLSGKSENDAVTLSWDEPDLTGGYTEPITVDFEDAVGVTAEYGDWTFVDVDGYAVGGFSSNGKNLEIPGITAGETKGSFWVWDNETITWATGYKDYEAHSGSKFLFALFPTGGASNTTDDWAISPLLSGKEQTISFYAKSYDANYAEQLQVLYTTVENVDADSFNADNFTLVAGSNVPKVPGDWTRYEVTLPEGAKHFAIRSYGKNAFMLMIDDIEYQPAGAVKNLEIAGYNVYRDGVKVNDATVEDMEYVDRAVADGKSYTYQVTAVYTKDGESAGSNEVSVTASVSGLDKVTALIHITVVDRRIVITGAEGLEVTVAAANGSVIFSGIASSRTVVEAAPGVYIVKTGDTSTKILVK